MKKRCEGEGNFVLWPLMLEAHSTLIEAVERELEAVGGVPLGWYDVLAQLALAPEHRLKMNELADSVLLSKSGVTRLVDRMERAELIERATCPTDRRVVYAQLTERGKELFDTASPVIQATIERRFTSLLTDVEARAMRNALDKVLDVEAEPGEQDSVAG